MLDIVTFGLAFVAYAMVCIDVVMHAAARPRRAFTVALAVVLVVHVGLVWGHRFGWSLETALAKGLPAFVVFHAATATIVAAAAAPEPWSGRLLYAAFPVVTMGSLGAAFMTPTVAVLRVPLVVVLLVTVGALVAIRRSRANA